MPANECGLRQGYLRPIKSGAAGVDRCENCSLPHVFIKISDKYKTFFGHFYNYVIIYLGRMTL